MFVVVQVALLARLGQLSFILIDVSLSRKLIICWQAKRRKMVMA